jgi:dTDP-4-amino-4,6-dideoxygalactose transaminase
MTTGDGGMFVTRHKDVAERISKARAFGVDRSFAERTIPGMYDVVSLGLNYRMSDINAALGRKQLARIGDILSRRKANFEQLKTAIEAIPGISIIDSQRETSSSSHYCLSVVLEGVIKGARNEVIARLNQAGVGTSVYYPQPVPRMTYYRNKYGYHADEFINAAAISDQSIALPVGPHLAPGDIDYVADSFRQTIKEISQ